MIDILGKREYNNTNIDKSLQVREYYGGIYMCDVTTNIKKYISENHISLSRIEKDTGIDVDNLHLDNNYKLKADEFLRLCRYLNVEPKYFATDTIKF